MQNARLEVTHGRQVRRVASPLALVLLFAAVPFVLAAVLQSRAPRPAPPLPASASRCFRARAFRSAHPDQLQVRDGAGPKSSVPARTSRSKEEAKALSFSGAKGVDFGPRGNYTTRRIYRMKHEWTPVRGETPRTRMVQGFGDVSFSLKVGEIGMAEYDPQKSPFGWHIVKRLK
jgi:hypothetical protein